MPRSRKTPPVTFVTWLKQAKPGEQLVYHAGGNRPDDRLFIDAWEAHLEGKVLLVQKREAGRLNYLAIRISPRATRFLRRAPRL